MWFYRIIILDFIKYAKLLFNKNIKATCKDSCKPFFHIITSRYVIFRTKAMHINSTHQCYVVVYDLPFDVMIHIVTIM